LIYFPAGKDRVALGAAGSAPLSFACLTTACDDPTRAWFASLEHLTPSSGIGASRFIQIGKRKRGEETTGEKKVISAWKHDKRSIFFFYSAVEGLREDTRERHIQQTQPTSQPTTMWQRFKIVQHNSDRELQVAHPLDDDSIRVGLGIGFGAVGGTPKGYSYSIKGGPAPSRPPREFFGARL
jgi:hypothetical protein